jgi:hypothetical protein
MMLVAALVATFLVASSGSTAAGSGSTATAPGDGTYNYSILQNGSPIGTSSVTVKRSDIGISLHETETLDQMNFAVDETLDAATLAPKSYVATYQRGAGSQTARVIFDDKGATMTFDGTNTNQPLPLPAGVKNGYVIEGALMTGFLFLPAQIHATKATDFAQYIPSKVLQGAGHVDSTGHPVRPAGVPAGDVSLSIRFTVPLGPSVNLDEWYDPATFALHAVSVPDQNVLMKVTK